MPQIYRFKRLIDKYSVDFLISVPLSGHYDDLGEWVDGGRENIPSRGALIPLSSRMIYESGGRLTGKDRQLITTVNLDGTFRVDDTTRSTSSAEGFADEAQTTGGSFPTSQDLTQGTYVIYKNRRYAVESWTEHGDYGDFNSYLLRSMSNFD